MYLEPTTLRVIDDDRIVRAEVPENKTAPVIDILVMDHDNKRQRELGII